MNRQARHIVGAVAATAGLMYFLDPSRGRRRRALLRDKAFSFTARAAESALKISRDLNNRAHGAVVVAQSMLLRRDDAVDAQIIEARVRTMLGRLVSHPSRIQVTASDGRVRLSGPILAQEVPRLLRAISRLRGVCDIENQLDVHDHADIPNLQGGRHRTGAMAEGRPSNWTPAVRLLMGTAGGALAAYAMGKRNPGGTLAGVLGLGLLTRATSNMETRRLVGPRLVDVQKTITIHAPVEEVFGFWANCENFPRFMRHVRKVRNHGEGRSHWVADGPLGALVSWDAEVTRSEPNHILEWRSMPGSMVENAGTVHFEDLGDNRTRVQLRIMYSPPAGAVGHALAWLMGRDLKTELNEDLVRFKTLIEQGRTRSRERKWVTKSELQPHQNMP